jgi:hypothetical protein
VKWGEQYSQPSRTSGRIVIKEDYNLTPRVPNASVAGAREPLLVNIFYNPSANSLGN